MRNQHKPIELFTEEVCKELRQNHPSWKLGKEFILEIANIYLGIGSVSFAHTALARRYRNFPISIVSDIVEIMKQAR